MNSKTKSALRSTLQKENEALAVRLPDPAQDAPAVPAELAAPVAEAPAAADTAGAIKSPMVGTVHLAPEPGRADFVKGGARGTSGLEAGGACWLLACWAQSAANAVYPKPQAALFSAARRFRRGKPS